MPKRKRERNEDFSYLRKKLKKLERRLNRSRRRSDSSSPYGDNFSPRNQLEDDYVAIGDETTFGNEQDNNLPGCSFWSDACHPDVPEPAADSDVESHVPVTSPQRESAAAHNIEATAARATTLTAPLPVTAPQPVSAPQAVSGPLPVTAPPQQPTEGDLIAQVPELDPELLAILGKDPACIREYSDDIQKDLAVRLNHVATCGLVEENRKELKDKYLIPANCKLIKAPTLNPEIRAALIETQAKRDKAIESKQEMTSCALSSLSAAITLHLSSNDKDPILLKLLMDTARILGDIQYTDSVSRRSFILSAVKKELRDQLDKTKIDEMLFGSTLTDTLKSAKTISKSGADIRAAQSLRPTIQRPVRTNSRPLNFRAPPASRRPLQSGGARGTRGAHPAPTPRQTTTTTRPAQRSAYRPSPRQPQTRYRR